MTNDSYHFFSEKLYKQLDEVLVTSHLGQTSLLNRVGGVGAWVAWVRGWRGSHFRVGGVGSVGP